MQKWKTTAVAILCAGTVAAGTPATAEPSKPDSDIAATPLDRVPSAQRAKMLAQDKARSAANQIRWAVERGDAPGFTGIELRDGKALLWYKGTPPAAVTAAVRRAGDTAPVEVWQAKYSLAEMRAASDRMVEFIRAHPGGPAHRVSMAADGSSLIVGVDPTVAGLSASSGLPDVAVPVRVVAQDRVHQNGRGNDFAPFWGGGAMLDNDWRGCTAGFGVRSGAQEYLLTAGHCGYPGQGWFNGDKSRWIGYATHENVGQDLLMIATDAGSYIFTGGPGSTAASHVYAWDWVYTGEELCSSGAVTTWLCGHVVMDAGNTSYCGYDLFNNWECYGGLVWSRQEDGALAGRNGDSGGPVVLPTTGGIVAKGIMSGAGGADLLWQDFGTAWQLWGITPIT